MLNIKKIIVEPICGRPRRAAPTPDRLFRRGGHDGPPNRIYV